MPGMCIFVPDIAQANYQKFHGCKNNRILAGMAKDKLFLRSKCFHLSQGRSYHRQ
jgi:hypothetical protein